MAGDLIPAIDQRPMEMDKRSERRLPALRSPALDHPLDDFFFAALLAP